MASIWYSLGRAVGRIPRPVRFGFTAIAVLGIYYFSAQPKQSPQSEKPELKSPRLISEERQAECLGQREQLASEYRNLMERERFLDAVNLVRPCAAALGNSELTVMLKEADRKLMIAKTKDPKTPPRERAELMQIVARLYPEESDGYMEKAKKILDAEDRKDAEADRIRRKREGVSIGMSQEEVLASNWGKPKDINSTITANGVREQWVYGGGNYLYFTDGKLTGIQK